jgi:hypothetical protein
MTYDEFIEYFNSDESKNEKKTVEDFFNEMRQSKHILTFEEWEAIHDHRYLFLTYDLIDVANYPNLYGPLNTWINLNLGFVRQLNNQDLTNNCFVTFPRPLDIPAMNRIANILLHFFSSKLPDFRIYLNIVNGNEYFLHP